MISLRVGFEKDENQKLSYIQIEKLEDLPKNITYLDIRDNIDIIIKDFKELIYLNISFCNPKSLFLINLPNLKQVTIGSSKLYFDISNLSIKNLPNFSYFQLRDCIVDSIILNHLPKLGGFIIQHSKINYIRLDNMKIHQIYIEKSIINSINLSNLINYNFILNIFNNKIASITLNNLIYLDKLVLANNELNIISLYNLYYLKYVDIHNNNLTSFVHDIKELEYLDIYHNKLKIFEPEKYLKLKELHIEHNPFYKQKIISRRRIYLLCESKEGTWDGLAECPLKRSVIDGQRESKEVAQNRLAELKESCEICYKCKKNINIDLKINIRREKYSYFTCC